MLKSKKPSILEANLIYLILGFALLFGGYIVQQREIYSGLLITEFIIILIPNIVYLKFRRYSLKNIFKLNPISFTQILYIFAIMMFAYPVAVFFNAVFLAIINSFTPALPTTVPLPTDLKEYLVSLFVIAVAPGICEEVMFRGTIKSAYDRFGYRKGILISAILFGVFHFNILNLVGPIFLGIILGILVNKTNSIYAAILGHTLNNGIALTIGYLMTTYTPEMEELSNTPSIFTDFGAKLISITIMGIFVFLSFKALSILFKFMPESNRYLDIFEFSEMNFTTNSLKGIKYLPIIIVFLVFIVLNIRLLF